MSDLAKDEQTLRDQVSSRAKAPLDPGTERMRMLLAEQCRLLGARLTGRVAATCSATAAATSVSGVSRAPTAGMPLSPRVRQTLDRLLHGDSEKQVARRLKLSPHTVHVYVKTLYRKMKVSSRGELLAKFVAVQRCN